MKRLKPGRTAFEYNSINTWILELIAERVNGQTMNELFGERVSRKIGAQADAYFAVTPDGYPMTYGTMSSSLRDFARFGMIFTPSWSKVSKAWIINDRILERFRQGDPTIYDQGFVGRYYLASFYEAKLSNRY